ncbi:hypothetical protein [Streptomyces chartreusis]
MPDRGRRSGRGVALRLLRGVRTEEVGAAGLRRLRLGLLLRGVRAQVVGAAALPVLGRRRPVGTACA